MNNTPAPPAPPLPGKRSGNAPRRTVLGALAFFLLLSSYTMLRPVRDDMAVHFGADRLHWLFTGTFLFTLLVVPLFGWLVRRIRRARILPAAYLFLVANLLLFSVAFADGATQVIAGTFFIWLSVFNLFVVSLFWSNVSDAFSKEESHRLYGYIAAGGTMGAIAGPATVAVAAKHLGTSHLLGLSALLLIMATLCMIAVRRNAPFPTENTTRPIGGSIIAGVSLTLQSARLRSIALLVICLTAVSTVLYVELIAAVAQTMPDSAGRQRFFASIDLAVNTLALLLQLLGTARIVKHGGLAITLSLAPLLVLVGLAGLGGIGAWATAIGFAAVQVLHRAGEYALNKPGREMIYTTVDPESRFKAKNFIDTAVYRANDAVSAWLINLVRGAGLNAVWLVGVPVALVWLVTGFHVGRQHDRDRSDKDEEQPHEPT
jgi:AAA family ATP:ADP antiporter